MEICIDFDGTCVTHEFPKIGREVEYAIDVMKELINQGHKLILFTMRSDIENPTSEDYNIKSIGGKYLTDAVNWFKENGIELYGVNANPKQREWTHSPKAYGQLYIDDAALGCPLLFDEFSNRHYVDWKQVERFLYKNGILKHQPYYR